MNAKTLAHTQPVDAVGARAERPVGPAPEARWYCLSREGMATLCTDEEDAKEVAAESFVLYPQSGPYRAVQMVDSAHVSPGAEAFLTPQDMADLQRLEDLFTDDQGWDLPKERMQRLAELGVIRRTSRDRYGLTAFGCWCVGEWRGLPLKTWQEQCDQAKREHLARVGA